MSLYRLVFATWLAATAGAAVSAEPRVFFAPAERAHITADRTVLRAQGVLPGPGAHPAAVAVAAGVEGVTAAPSAAAPRIDGLSVTRDGHAIAWIGGRRYDDGALFEGRRLQVTAAGVRFAGADGTARLRRVGEAVSGPPGPRTTSP